MCPDPVRHLATETTEESGCWILGVDGFGIGATIGKVVEAGQIGLEVGATVIGG